jgi:hypothetical protein
MSPWYSSNFFIPLLSIPPWRKRKNWGPSHEQPCISPSGFPHFSYLWVRPLCRQKCSDSGEVLRSLSRAQKVSLQSPIFILFFRGSGFELRALQLLGWHSTTWTMLQLFFLSVIFFLQGLTFLPGSSLWPQSSYLHLCMPPCLGYKLRWNVATFFLVYIGEHPCNLCLQRIWCLPPQIEYSLEVCQ